MTRKEILETAMKCVLGDRDKQYGNPEDNFGTIAKLWTTYLKAINIAGDIPINCKDVAAMMVLLKVARLARNGGIDSWVDIAGYAAIGGEVSERE